MVEFTTAKSVYRPEPDEWHVSRWLAKQFCKIVFVIPRKQIEKQVFWAQSSHAGVIWSARTTILFHVLLNNTFTWDVQLIFRQLIWQSLLQRPYCWWPSASSKGLYSLVINDGLVWKRHIEYILNTYSRSVPKNKLKTAKCICLMVFNLPSLTGTLGRSPSTWTTGSHCEPLQSSPWKWAPS